MPYTPPGLLDNDVGSAASAANVKSWLQSVGDYADSVAGMPGMRLATDEGILPANSAATNSAAIALLIADINAGGLANVFFPPGTYQFDGAFPVIRQNGVSFLGAGKLATKLVQASSSTSGTFFQIGSRTDAGGALTNVRTVGFDCRDMWFDCSNTPPAGQNVFSLVQTDMVHIERIRINGVAGLITVGSSNDDGSGAGTGGAVGCPRTTVRDVGGDVANVAGNVIWLRMCGGNTTFENIMLRGAVDDGKWIFIQPCNRTNFSAVEGVQFDKVDVWGNPVAGVRPAVNVHIDVANGGARNINFSKCLWDTSDGATVKLSGTADSADAGTRCIRLIRFNECYFNSNITTGKALFIDYDTPAPGYCEAIYVVNCKMSLMDSEAVRVMGAGRVSEVMIDGCTVVDLKPTRSLALPAAFIFEKGDWTVVNNTFRGGVTPVDDQNVNYAIAQTVAANNYIAANNRSAGLNTGFFNGTTGANKIDANNTHVP